MIDLSKESNDRRLNDLVAITARVLRTAGYDATFQLFRGMSVDDPAAAINSGGAALLRLAEQKILEDENNGAIL
jgi:hypothetical protein